MAVRSRSNVKTAGGLCLVAGVLGAASGVLLIAVTPEVAETRYSYPLAAGAFVVIQVWFALQHLGLLAGQRGLAASGAGGSSRHVAWAHGLGQAGMALLALTELLAVGAADDVYPSTVTNVLDGLYGLSCLAVGVGMTVVGIGVLRRCAWTSWRRWVPLAIGVWVFVPMTPAIMAGYLPARLTITIWMVLYALLGWVLMSTSSRVAVEPRLPGVNAS